MTARDCTRIITEAGETALHALQYFNGRIVNGFGELSDPSLARHQLLDAKSQVETALVALASAERIGWTKGDD